jgi:hypothetical protein
MAGKPHLSPKDRQERDELILRLFLGGWSEREMARHPRINLHHTRVNRIIKQQLVVAADRFGLISEQALVVYSERLETLIRAIWPRATDRRDPDPKAIEVARRLLEQQGKLYQLSDEKYGMPMAPMSDSELSDDVIELQRYRERHRKPPEAI